MRAVKLSLPRKSLSGQKRNNAHAEDDLQMSICKYHRLGVPSTYTLFAVPNGGKRDKAEAGRLLMMGVMAGVSDLILLGPDKLIVFIEVKLAKTVLGQKETTQSDDQVAFEHRVNAMGFPYVVVRSLKEYYEVLQRFGVKTYAVPL